MTNITAKMAHSKESVELMCITQYNTFEFGKKIALLVISAALIVFGVVAQVSTSISLVCIMIGCFMLTGRNAVAKSRADAVIKQLGGQLPVFNYSFGPTKFSFNPDTEPVSYTSFPVSRRTAIICICSSRTAQPSWCRRTPSPAAA